MIFRTLKADEVNAWCAHCQEVFEDERAGYFRDHYQFDPETENDLIFVAMDEDTIASTLRVFKRRIWLHGTMVRMGGIGEVSTKPAYRRQGLAAELLTMAISEMEARNMPVSILFGDERIYEKAGWRFCPCRYTHADIDTLSVLPEDVSVVDFDPVHLPVIMGIYDLFAGRLDGAVMRNAAYWRGWVLPQWKRPYVLSYEGKVAAYISAGRDRAGTLRVYEIGAAPQVEWLLPGLIRWVAAQEGCQAASVLTAVMPTLMGKSVTDETGMMVRLNAPVEGLRTTDDLVAAMPSAGVFGVDHF